MRVLICGSRTWTDAGCGRVSLDGALDESDTMFRGLVDDGMLREMLLASADILQDAERLLVRIHVPRSAFL